MEGLRAPPSIMPIELATKTLEKIDAYLERDQGNRYRELLQGLLPAMADAYRQDSDRGHRSHIGASQLGRKCTRDIWYSWRWATVSSFSGRILRLFNRGHLEEARLVALLQMIGCDFHQFDENGGQFRIAGLDGHYGGGLDGVVVGIPEYPDEPVLTEFKTHNDKSFKKLEKSGVYTAKFEHYVQMQQYMGFYGLKRALYIAVNKNDDHIYAEIIDYNPMSNNGAFDRANRIFRAVEAPSRINKSPSWYECQFCSHKGVCHMGEPADVNCRTCVHSSPASDATWVCSLHKKTLTKAEQLAACSSYSVLPGITAEP